MNKTLVLYVVDGSGSVEQVDKDLVVAVLQNWLCTHGCQEWKVYGELEDEE